MRQKRRRPPGRGWAIPRPLDAPDVVNVRQDVVLRIPEPYTPDAALNGEHRCFMLDPALVETTFMTGCAMLPDAGPIVHHGILYHAPARLRASTTASAGNASRTPGCRTRKSSARGRRA